jgi:hypothetical protein
MLRRAARWMFSGPEASAHPLFDAIVWWELRRIPFNLILGSYGLLCLLLFAWALDGSGNLAPGEDAIEPMLLIAAPIAINVLYTLGWLLEVPVRAAHRGLSLQFGPLLLKVGMGLGIVLSSIPALYWLGYWLFH